MYVASLFARTPEQIAEEEALYVEIKKLEQKERRFAKERDELMKVVAGIESGLHIHQPDEEVASGLFVDPKKRKKKPDGTDAESPAPGPSTGHTKKAVSNKQAHIGMFPFFLYISCVYKAFPFLNCRPGQLCHSFGYVTYGSVYENSPHTRSSSIIKTSVPQSKHCSESHYSAGRIGNQPYSTCNAY